MKTQKLNFESFASEELSRKQKTVIMGKGDPTPLPEVDEHGNIVGSGPGGTGPGDGLSNGTGDGKNQNP